MDIVTQCKENLSHTLLHIQMQRQHVCPIQGGPVAQSIGAGRRGGGGGKKWCLGEYQRALLLKVLCLLSIQLSWYDNI